MANQNSIQTIKNYFERHNGLQLANRFQVNFSGLPLGIWRGPIEIQAQQIELPPRSISTVQDGLIGFGNGRFVPRSQNILPGPGVIIAFPITNDNYLLEFFNNWFNYIYTGPRSNNNYTNPFVVQYYDNSVFNSTMYLDYLDPNGEVNSTMTFYEVFPAEIQPIRLSMTTPDSYVSLVVTFGFRDFVHNFN